MVRKIFLAGVAGAVLATPVLAEAEIRASAPVEGESELGTRSPLIFVVGIAAVAAAIVFLSEDDDEPASP